MTKIKKQTKAQIKKIAKLAANFADDKKAKNIRLLDLKGKSSLADFVIITTTMSRPQMEAVEYEVNKNLKAENVYQLHKDGRTSTLWKIIDYGGFIVHIMTKQARDFYMLDEIYGFAKEIEWKEKDVKKPRRKSK